MTGNTFKSSTFLFTIVLCLQYPDSSEGLKVKKVAEIAIEVIQLSIEFSKEIMSENNFDKIENSIAQLHNRLDNLYNKLEYTTEKVKELFDLIDQQTYKVSFTPHINRIKSCMTDFNTFLQKPNSTAARENFRKCYYIIDDARAIFNSLSGHSIIGIRPFLELYRHKDGSFNGLAIKTLFQYLFRYFIDGCTGLVAAERFEFNQSSRLYSDECLKMIDDINSYMESLYRKCFEASCPWFTSQVTELLLRPGIKDVSSAMKAVQDNFPWLKVFLVETKAFQSAIENKGTFPLNFKTFPFMKNYIQLYWTESSVSFDKSNKTEKALFVNLTISICEHMHSSNGMNLSKTLYEEEKLYSFIGYTTDHSNYTCKYKQKLNPPSSSPGKPELTFTNCLFLFFYTFFFNFEILF